jgi:predicted lysophospholipase L1 biosynthesis ABC-type transport system permease subunit
MDSNHNFFEAMKLVTTLSKEQQDRFISEIRQFQRDNVFEQLQVGSIVKINHKKVDPMIQFRVTKINRKNVKVKQLNGNNVYSVGASLLEVVK